MIGLGDVKFNNNWHSNYNWYFKHSPVIQDVNLFFCRILIHYTVIVHRAVTINQHQLYIITVILTLL